MNCTDETVGLSLADYYTGELALDDRLRVEAHVAKCEDCRKSLALMMALGGQSPEAYGSDHLSPELLSQYFQKQSDWPKVEAEKIRQHLKSCDNCRREYDFLTGLESELEAALEATEATSTDGISKTSIWQSTWHLVSHPALAWAVVLLLAYPTVDWLSNRTGPDTQEILTQVVGPVHKLAEARRGLEGTVEIVRDAGEQLLQLAIPMYAIPPQMDYRFLFRLSETEVSVELRVIANFQVTGQIILLVDALALADGVYELTVVETDKASSEIKSERTFSFKLSTRP